MNILQQLHDFDYIDIDIESDETLTAAKQSAIVNVAKKAVNRAYRYYAVRHEMQTLLWDEIVQEALVGVYGALGQSVRAAYQSGVWAAFRFLHQLDNNPDGVYNVARLHESYEAMVEQMGGGEYGWQKSVVTRPTERTAFYNLERAARSWQDTRLYWHHLRDQALLELAAASHDATDDEDTLWRQVNADLFGAFCEMREVHQLKPLSIYTHIIIQRARNVTHEEIAAELQMTDPIEYMNALNRAFQSLEELAELSAEAHTERMQRNHGLILHYTELEQDMSALLSETHRKHIIIFPFGALSLTKPLTKGKRPQRVGKFEMQYFPSGDWRSGKRCKVSVTTPPLAVLTYGQLRECALRFVDRVRTAGGEEIAREFFGPAVLHHLING